MVQILMDFPPFPLLSAWENMKTPCSFHCEAGLSLVTSMPSSLVTVRDCGFIFFLNPTCHWKTPQLSFSRAPEVLVLC